MPAVITMGASVFLSLLCSVSLFAAAVWGRPAAAAAPLSSGIRVAPRPSAGFEEFELTSRVFGNTRTIRVLLPPGYHDADRGAVRYPVFYFTDGVAAFDPRGWGVPVVAESLWRAGLPEAVVVGIDNGGSTRESTRPLVDRAAEYLPYPDPSWTEAPVPVPRGERFPEFLFDEVMPEIRRRYRVSVRPEDTGLAGSSFGAAVVLYAVIARPDRVGRLLLESPSLHVGEGRLIRDAGAGASLPSRIHVGVGDREGDAAASQREMVANVDRLVEVLERASPPPRLHVVRVAGGIHWFTAWRERLPGALAFLLSR